MRSRWNLLSLACAALLLAVSGCDSGPELTNEDLGRVIYTIPVHPGGPAVPQVDAPKPPATPEKEGGPTREKETEKPLPR